MLTVSRIPNVPRASDSHYVLRSAGALGIGEFNLFELADRWWHGDGRPVTALERIFVHYLYTGAAPPWVRQFCRTVLEMADSGELDPRHFGAPSVPARPPRPSNGRASFMLDVAGPALIFAMFLLLIESVI